MNRRPTTTSISAQGATVSETGRMLAAASSRRHGAHENTTVRRIARGGAGEMHIYKPVVVVQAEFYLHERSNGL